MMAIEKTVRRVDTDSLDRLEEETRISFGPIPERLVQSIESMGIVSPPVVYNHRNNCQYKIVTGFRRIEVARKIGHKHVECLIIEDKTDTSDLFLISLHEHALKRELNHAEKALALLKCRKYFPPEAVVKELLPVLGLEPSFKILDQYLTIASLGREILWEVAKGVIDPGAGLILAKFNPGARNVLFGLLKALGCSASIQKEILNVFWEITKRNDKEPGEILRDGSLAEVLNDPGINRRRKTEFVRNYLRRKRYPILVQYEERIRQKIANLGLPQATRLKPPPYFEGQRWTVEITFQSPDDLSQKLEALDALVRSEKFSDLL